MLKFLASSKDAFASLESIFKILALILAGCWTYLLFVKTRKKYPRLVMHHRARFWDVDEQNRVLRVTLDLKNDSEVLLDLRKGHTWIQQMKPWPKRVLAQIKEGENPADAKSHEVPWPLLHEVEFDFQGQRELEPQEKDELVMEFVLRKEIEQVLIYSFFENRTKPGRNMGWMLSTVVNFTSESKGDRQIEPTANEGQSKPKPGSADEENLGV
jgi:hypothetical protein